MTTHQTFDVIIIGGSYAGLSAAMALGRSLRNVLLIDSGLPCNRQTPHSHNFLTQDGKTPAAIAADAKAQVLKYETIRFLNDRAVDARQMEKGFSVTTGGGKSFDAKKLIFATGIKDLMPDIKGFAECWGISVVHCPYCHGFEIRNRKTGIFAPAARAMHLAPLVKNLTEDVTIFTATADLSTDDLEKLKKHRIEVLETEISEIHHENGYLHELTLVDGSIRKFDALYAAVPFSQHSELPELLGCELTEQGYIATDGFQQTTVKGIYACGDNSVMMRSVANAVYSGNLTGAALNKELADEAF